MSLTVQILTVQSAEEVTRDLLSGLHAQAIYQSTNTQSVKAGSGYMDKNTASLNTYDATLMSHRKLHHCITGLAVVEEDLEVRSDTSKVIS